MKTKLLMAALVLGTVALSLEVAVAKPTAVKKKNKNMTEEQHEKMIELFQKYKKSVDPLLEKIHAKQLQLNAISVKNDVDLEQVKVFSEEIATLYTELRERKFHFQERVYKETGIYLDNIHESVHGAMHGAMGSMCGAMCGNGPRHGHNFQRGHSGQQG